MIMQDPDFEAADEQIVRVKSRPPSEKELFYLELGKDLVKNQFNLANELLKQIISLCVTLLSVSVIFDKLFEANTHLKFFAVLLFFLSLIAACIGIYPFEKSNVWLNSPSEIEQFKDKALLHKKTFYAIAGIFLFCGIGVIVLAVLQEVFYKTK